MSESVELSSTVDNLGEGVLTEEEDEGHNGEAEHVDGLVMGDYLGVFLSSQLLWSHVSPSTTAHNETGDEGIVESCAETEIGHFDR